MKTTLIAIVAALIAVAAFAQGTSVPGSMNIRGDLNVEKTTTLHGVTTAGTINADAVNATVLTANYTNGAVGGSMTVGQNLTVTGTNTAAAATVTGLLSAGTLSKGGVPVATNAIITPQTVVALVNGTNYTLVTNVVITVQK